MSQIFKTINYSFFDNKKTNLIVVFPQAMQTLNESNDLVKLVSKIGNILFIESGYFGITKIDQLDKASLYSMSEFKKNIFDLIRKYPHKKLYLIAGSVGAIHALSFLETHPRIVQSVVLAGPALYKKRGILDRVYQLLLSLGIKFYPDKFFGALVKLAQKNPKTPWLESTYRSVMSSIGTISYFLCLKEIINFPTMNFSKLEKLLSSKVHIFLGEDDTVFQLLCNEELCKKCKSCDFVKSDHSALNGSKEDIYKLLNSLQV